MRRFFAKGFSWLLTGFFILLGAAACLPVVFVVTGSVMDAEDLDECLRPVYELGQGFVTWKLIPNYPTLEHYRTLLFETPEFFVLFWNSVKLVVCILVGQLLVGVPAAWAFAVYDVRGKNALFTLYVVLMLLPFQVTMLSSYLVLNRLSLLNTHLAVILPAVFSAFPVFLTYGGFRGIPPELLEAARIDGAGEWYLFAHHGLKLGRGGILSALVLGFLDYWNMMEQPLAFLEDEALWPLSLYLPQLGWQQAGWGFAASVVVLIPAGLVFAMGQDYLEQGILYSGLKA